MLLHTSDAHPPHGPTDLGTPLIVKELLLIGIFVLLQLFFHLVLFTFLSVSIAGAWIHTLLSVNNVICGHYIILLSIKMITCVV